MTLSPKGQLADHSQPKCANCKWRMNITVKGPYGEIKPLVEVHGKGACMEPSVAAAYPILFYVTDLMLCSMWERKES